MIDFFARPATAEEAVRIRMEHPDAVYAAGTTDISVKLYAEKLAANGLIDITHIPDLRGIDEQAHAIGALTTFSDILRFSPQTDEVRLMRDMAHSLAATQVRNRATVGGNISNANPSSDSAPVLCVLNAEAVVLTPEGEKPMPVSDYLKMRTEGNTSPLLLRFNYGELPKNSAWQFEKIGRRTSLAIARINACAVLSAEDGVITDARLSLGAVSKVTGRFAAAEKALIGRKVCEESFIKAGEAAYEEAYAYIGGRASAEYKLAVVKDLVPEMFRKCAAKLEGTV